MNIWPAGQKRRGSAEAIIKNSVAKTSIFKPLQETNIVSLIELRDAIITNYYY